MSQMEAELKLPLVQNSQSRGSAALRHIANCPSNVRWRRVRTDGRLLDTLTEPSSLWSMSPLSSPCRMETAPGFPPWKLVIPHCGTPCLVFNFPINNFSQHLFARAGRCRGWCPAAWFKIGRRSKLLAQTKQTPDEVASSSHGWEWRFYALVIMQINRICLVLNFSINSLSQHLFARAGRCRGWCPVSWFKIGRRSKLLAQTKQTPDEVAASSHGWEWRFYTLVILQITRISDSSCKKTSLRISMSQVEAELKLPLVQNSQSRGSAALRHIANCPTNVHWQLPDFLIPWLNLATLTLRGNTHTQIIPNPSQSSKHLISHDNWKKTCLRIAMSQMEAALKFPHVQNSQSRAYAALTHAANCASNVCGQMADFLIPWLNIVRCGPCLRCHPRAGSNQLRDFHHGD